MKTGANPESDSIVDADAAKATGRRAEEREAIVPALPTSDPFVEAKEEEEVKVKVAGGVARENDCVASWDGAKEGDERDATPKEGSAESVSSGGNTSPESSDDDEDFLDLLVDTLDGEFDPNLLL